LVLGIVAAGAVVGAAAPSFASSSPVTVHQGPDGTSVGVTVVQPLVGASVSNSGNVCVGISFEVPVCTDS